MKGTDSDKLDLASFRDIGCDLQLYPPETSMGGDRAYVFLWAL